MDSAALRKLPNSATALKAIRSLMSKFMPVVTLSIDAFYGSINSKYAIHFIARELDDS
jgi:hypothetical protein